ncbi:MAG: DUF2062 domain-containing protein, partial [Propionibacteriaceae bacterium]|nr:DUF2062 domain-containing protein [Propionibacteriaceae bacterium]
VAAIRAAELPAAAAARWKPSFDRRFALRQFRRYLPTRDQLLRQRLLRPFASLLGQTHLWHFNRRAVAAGLAIGLFFGLLAPVAQIFLAAGTAILLRANLPVAALATLVTNPLTTPPLYLAAYHLGGWLLQRSSSPAGFPWRSSDLGWWAGIMQWAGTVGPAVGVGLAVIAVTSSAMGYLIVHVAWRVAIQIRRRRRRMR